MNIIWVRAAVSLVSLALVSSVIALFTSARWGVAFAALVLILQNLFHIFHAQRLWRLLDAPVYGEVPSAPGLWGEIYYRLHKMARRWHGQVRQVEQQHSRFIQGIQASPDGVVMLDEHNQIDWCNSIAELHFGLDAKRDVRQHVSHLVRQPEFVRYVNTQEYDRALVMRGMGEKRQIVLSVQAFPYGDNRKLVVSRDITEVERTDAMRRDFVANVSHELKTPLTVLSGFLETMHELQLSEAERARYFDIMSQQSIRMQNIVNDLLVLAKLEGDSRPPSDKALDMRSLLRHLHDDARALAGEKQQVLVDFDEGLTVNGTEAEIVSAFSNLVSNAVRYTPDGGTIRIVWQEDAGCAQFAVIDTGFGIPREHIPRLTERFYRVDRSRSRDTGGTGLGLAIVKHVLQRHDAQLLIDSEVGHGSTFKARFPKQRTVRCQPAVAEPV